MDSNRYSLRFSVEELCFLMRALNISMLIGFTENIDTAVSSEDADRILAAGFNSLRVRQLVSVVSDQDAQLAIESIVIAYLGICATASHVVSTARTSAEGDLIPGYLHLGEHMCVVHSIQEPGIHEFTGIVDALQGIDLLLAPLTLADEPDTSDPEIRISQHVFEQIAAAAHTQQLETGIALLEQEGVGHAQAAALVTGITDAIAQTVVSGLTLYPEEKRNVEAFIILESPGVSRQIRTHTNGEKQVHIRSIDRQSCSAEVSRLLQSSRTTQEPS